MNIVYLSKDFAIAPQPTPEELARLKEKGFAAVVCNRPDGETPGQPTFEEMAACARQCGMDARHLPVLPGKVTPADADAFAALLAELPKPVLAYCRTGNRAETLWRMAQDRSPADKPGGAV